MIKKQVHVANIKCGGCAHSIESALNQLDGVSQSKVAIEDGRIDLELVDLDILNTVLEKLSKMGYPEVSKENSLFMKAQSYAHCMIGKVNK